MKKNMSKLLIIIGILVVFSVGCSQANPPPPEAPFATTPTPIIPEDMSVSPTPMGSNVTTVTPTPLLKVNPTGIYVPTVAVTPTKVVLPNQ